MKQWILELKPESGMTLEELTRETKLLESIGYKFEMKSLGNTMKTLEFKKVVP